MRFQKRRGHGRSHRHFHQHARGGHGRGTRRLSKFITVARGGIRM